MITRQQWITLFAAQAGYMLDAMDVLLFVFAVNVLRDQFHLSATEAGLVSSCTLAFSAIGGIAFGVFMDRYGRARALVWSIVIYSVASAGTALSWSLASLLFWRGLIGVGLGAEWSAGAVLVAETWPAEHRAKAVGIMQSGWALGYLLAAGMTALVLPRFGWKILFLTGLFPAFIALLLRRKLEEPEIWKRRVAVPVTGIFRGILLRRTVMASLLATSVLFAYWVFGGTILTPIYGASHDERTLLWRGRQSVFWERVSSVCLAQCWRNSIRQHCAEQGRASSTTWDAD